MRSSRGSRAESAGSRHRRRLPKALLAVSMLIVVAALLFAVVAPAPASAAATISGIVRDTDANFLGGVTVTAYTPDGTYAAQATTVSSITGYTLPSLAAGTYYVQFILAGYVTQWWENKPAMSTATPVVVASTAVTGVNATLVANAPVPGPTTTITAPALGAGPYAPGSSITVNWTTSSAVTSGSFGLWVRQGTSADTYTWRAPRTTVLATTARIGTTTNYTATITVPLTGWAGAGNYVIVARSANTGGGDWVANSWATSPGSFTITGAVAQSLTVTQPSGLGGIYATTDDLTVNWTMAQASTGGTFDVWVRSASGSSWYLMNGSPFAGSASLNFSKSVALNTFTPAVPAGLGYEAIVRYTPATGVADALWGTSPAKFQVTGATPGTVGLAISAPHAPTLNYAQSSSVLVSWTTDVNTLNGGQFGVWVRNSSNVFYAYNGTARSATGISSYNLDLALTNAPAGLYQVVMAYKAIPDTGDWGNWATSPGWINVTAATPTLSAFTSAVGNPVTVAGTFLTGATLVTFTTGAGTATAVPTVNSATSITVTPPAGAITGNCTVTTPGGPSAPVTFTLVLTPVLTSISGAGTGVGTFLSGATLVTFTTLTGTVTAVPTVTGGGTGFTCTVPGTAITGPCTVTTPGGTSNIVTWTHP